MPPDGEVVLRVTLPDGARVDARVPTDGWLATIGDRQLSIASPASWTTFGHEASTVVYVDVEGHLLSLHLPTVAQAAALRRALATGALAATLVAASGVNASHEPIMGTGAGGAGGGPGGGGAAVTTEPGEIRITPTARPVEGGSTIIELPDAWRPPAPTHVATPVQAEPPATPPAAVEELGAVPGVGSQTYAFNAKLDFDAATLDVVETLKWTNLAPTKAHWIDLSVIPAEVKAFKLTGDVLVDAVPAQAGFEGHRTNLRVRFPNAVAPGQTVRIVVPFRLEVGPNSGALGGRLSAKQDIIQFGEWFPVWSTAHGFDDIGDPQLSWNAESISLDLTSTTELGTNAVAASGKLQAGATASHWVFEASDVRDFAFSVSPLYKMVTTRVGSGEDSTEVRAYAARASARSMLRDAVTAFTTFEARFGEYGYDTFSVAEIGDSFFSMEFPQVVFIGARSTGDASLIAHEVAHQWWYGLVGNDQMAEPWLDESFAEFSRWLVAGRPEFSSTRPINESVDAFTKWVGPNEYLATVYRRGAAFLEDLRQRMGDEAFFGSLREIVSSYRHQVVSTTIVLEIFRAATDESIEDIVAEYGLA